MHAVVLASDAEGIPVSLMEAMSYEIPVIATNVGGNPELLSGGCGMMVPPRNPDALADAIAQVLGDPRLAASLASAGRARVEAEFDVVGNTAALAALFAESVPARRAATAVHVA